jgi:hypothetical protein
LESVAVAVAAAVGAEGEATAGEWEETGPLKPWKETGRDRLGRAEQVRRLEVSSKCIKKSELLSSSTAEHPTANVVELNEFNSSDMSSSSLGPVQAYTASWRPGPLSRREVSWELA